MKLPKLFFILVPLFFLLSGGYIGPQYLNSIFIDSQPESAVRDKILSKSEINEDLDLIFSMLEKTYVGVKYLPKDNLKQFKANLNGLRSLDQITTYQFYKEIEKVFHHVLDNHLEVEIREYGCGGQPSLTSERVKGNKDWEVSFKKWGSLEVPVLKIRRFSDPNLLVWKGYLERLQELKKNPRLIIDLRDNIGGFRPMANETAALLTGMANHKLIFYDEELNPDSKYILRLRDFWDCRYRFNSSNSNWIFQFKQFVNLFKEAPAPTASSTESQKTNIAYSGTIFVLTNKNTASTSEHLVSLLQNFKNVYVIGQNTSGSFHYVNSGLFQLSQSKLLIKWGTYFVGLKDGRYIEKVGLTPDLIVADNEDALEWLLNSRLKFVNKKD